MWTQINLSLSKARTQLKSTFGLKNVTAQDISHRRRAAVRRDHMNHTPLCSFSKRHIAPRQQWCTWLRYSPKTGNILVITAESRCYYTGIRANLRSAGLQGEQQATPDSISDAFGAANCSRCQKTVHFVFWPQARPRAKSPKGARTPSRVERAARFRRTYIAQRTRLSPRRRMGRVLTGGKWPLSNWCTDPNAQAKPSPTRTTGNRQSAGRHALRR